MNLKLILFAVLFLQIGCFVNGENTCPTRDVTFYYVVSFLFIILVLTVFVVTSTNSINWMNYRMEVYFKARTMNPAQMTKTWSFQFQAPKLKSSLWPMILLMVNFIMSAKEHLILLLDSVRQSKIIQSSIGQKQTFHRLLWTKLRKTSILRKMVIFYFILFFKIH